MSKKHIGLVFVGAIIAITLVAVVAIHQHKSENMAMPMGIPAAAVATSNIAIHDFMFSPMAIKVRVGTTVTWTNQDSVHHTITMDNRSAGGPASGEVGQGQTYSYTFSKAGAYTYHCMPHPYMHGTVLVTN